MEKQTTTRILGIDETS